MKQKALRITFTAAIILVSVQLANAEPARILRHVNAVPGRWMVLLADTVTTSAFNGVVDSLAATYDLTVTTRWPDRSMGFICDNAPDTNIRKLANDPRVKLIEQDFQIVFSSTQDSTWNGQYLWNLDRLDEPTYWQSDSTYDMCPEARTIYAYVLDMGVRADHEQFTLGEPSSRVVYSRAFDDNTATGYADTTSGCTQGQIDYGLFHGTAVASMLAGTTVGSAKTKVISLRIIGCNRNSLASYIVNAIQWIRGSNDPYAGQPAVVNMSSFWAPWLNTSASDINTINSAINALVTRTGIPFFTAADNFAGDACQFSPASLAYTNVNHSGTVFTVGGSSVGANGDKNDYRWQTWSNGQAVVGGEAGSNGGGCVSIYAPALGIYVAETTSSTAYGLHDGTSFASPLVAGVAARYMERTGVRDYISVYNHLLSAAAATGTVVNNVNTPEYWLCAPQPGQTTYYTSFTNPGVCPSGWVGLNGTSTPIHMPATFNESNAGMIYSDMSCP